MNAPLDVSTSVTFFYYIMVYFINEKNYSIKIIILIYCGTISHVAQLKCHEIVFKMKVNMTFKAIPIFHVLYDIRRIVRF